LSFLSKAVGAAEAAAAAAAKAATAASAEKRKQPRLLRSDYGNAV